MSVAAIETGQHAPALPQAAPVRIRRAAAVSVSARALDAGRRPLPPLFPSRPVRGRQSVEESMAERLETMRRVADTGGEEVFSRLARRRARAAAMRVVDGSATGAERRDPLVRRILDRAGEASREAVQAILHPVMPYVGRFALRSAYVRAEDGDVFERVEARNALFRAWLRSAFNRAENGTLKERLQAIREIRAALFNNADKAPLLRAEIDGHILICSGPGGGKTSTLVFSNLLDWPTSLVCLDPKGECFAVTAAERTRKGHKVYAIKPGDPNSASVNIMGALDFHKDTYMQRCGELASCIVEKSASGDGKFFENTAVRIIGFVIAWKVAQWATYSGVESERPNIGHIFDFFYEKPTIIEEQIRAVYDELKEPDNFTKYGDKTAQIRAYAGSFIDGDTERTWPNILASVTKDLDFAGIASLRRVLSGRQCGDGEIIDPKDILSGKVSIYLCVEPTTMETYPAFGRLLLATFGNTVMDAKGDCIGQVMLLCDEMMTLKAMPLLHQTFVNQGRGAGLMLVGVIQSPAMLDQAAGQNTYKGWLSAVMFSIWFSIKNDEERKMLSGLVGQATIETITYSVTRQKARSHGFFGGSLSEAISITRAGRALLDEAEVGLLPRDYAMIIRRVGPGGEDARRFPEVGVRPMVVRLPFAKTRREFKDRMSRNPYGKKTIADFNVIPEGDLVEDLFGAYYAVFGERVTEEYGAYSRKVDGLDKAPAKGRMTDEDAIRDMSEGIGNYEADGIGFGNLGEFGEGFDPEAEAAREDLILAEREARREKMRSAADALRYSLHARHGEDEDGDTGAERPQWPPAAEDARGAAPVSFTRALADLDLDDEPTGASDEGHRADEVEHDEAFFHARGDGGRGEVPEGDHEEHVSVHEEPEGDHDEDHAGAVASGDDMDFGVPDDGFGGTPAGFGEDEFDFDEPGPGGIDPDDIARR